MHQIFLTIQVWISPFSILKPKTIFFKVPNCVFQSMLLFICFFSLNTLAPQKGIVWVSIKIGIFTLENHNVHYHF